MTNTEKHSAKKSNLKLLLCVGLAVALWIIGPYITNQLPAGAWNIFAVFATVIFAFILRPYPMGAIVIMGLLVLVLSDSITLKESLSGYGNSTVWLVVTAFLLADGVIRTGLGKRVALSLVQRFGNTLAGLSYAICGAELILGPVIPSNTARGGGVLAPIVDALSRELGSSPKDSPESAGSYLTLLGAHANLITAAMFLTGMAANPLVSNAVFITTGVEFGWLTWALGAIIPGITGLILLPWVLRKIVKPTIKDTKPAQGKAKEELQKMGAISLNEWVMSGVLLLMILLWSTKGFHGWGTTLVALIGIVLLLITRVVSWDNIIKNSSAWDALIWLGGLLTMANMLKKYGFIDWFVGGMERWLTSFDGIVLIVLIAVFYFYSMYFFSMLTAHISAMAGAFVALIFTLTGQPYIGAAIIAYISCLSGCLTNYSTGPVIIYFGLNYVKPNVWFKTGFLISLFHLVIWLLVGGVWWKFLGWW